MGQRSLTITLPDAPERRHQLLMLLCEQGCISESEVLALEKDDPKSEAEPPEDGREKGRWAPVAEQISSNGYLRGSTGKTLRKYIQGLREDFEIRGPLRPEP